MPTCDNKADLYTAGRKLTTIRVVAFSEQLSEQFPAVGAQKDKEL